MAPEQRITNKVIPATRVPTTLRQAPRQARDGAQGTAWAVTFLLFVIAGATRIWDLGNSVTWDEPLWAFRSVHFLNALIQGRPGDTFQIGAPGVITMWSGATGIAFQRFLLQQDAEAWTQVVNQPYLDLHDQATLKALGRFLPITRIPLVLLNACLLSSCVA